LGGGNPKINSKYENKKVTARTNYPFNEEDARKFYRWLRHNQPGEWTEIRAIEWVPEGKGRSNSFYVDNEDDFVRICSEWNGKRQVYAGCNPRRTRRREGARAEDIARVTVIPFDVDGPVPDKRRNAATDAEVQVAWERAQKLIEWLKQQGYGNPYVDFSGNGYRVALPVDISFEDHKRIGAQLRAFFNEVKSVFPFLENISDLPRIIKVPGSWSIKGSNTTDRPHRQAYIVQLGNMQPNENVKQHILSIDVPTYASEKPETERETPIQLDDKKIQRLRPCYKKFLKVGGRLSKKDDRAAETGLRFSLVQEMHKAGFSREEILEACKKFDDYDPEKSRYEVDRELDKIRSEGAQPWSCKAIFDNGGCLGPTCPYYKVRIEGKEQLEEEKPVAVEVGETFTYTGDRPFKGRVQVVALGFPEARFTRITFKCGDPTDCEVDGCPLENGISLDIADRSKFDPSAFATYFDTNKPIEALRVHGEKFFFKKCARWLKKAVYKGYDEKAVTRGILVDLQAREGRAWFIHGSRCDLSKAPNWIIAEGWLCKGARGRIGVLITGFTHEAEVMAPNIEDIEKSKEVLRRLPSGDDLEGCGAYKIAEILRKKVNAKGDEVKKGFVADLLTIAGPVWVLTPESGEKELGPTTCELGPSTNYKSQRAKRLIAWLGAGKYLRGRKTEAGLTAGLEKIEGMGWVAKKGALPSADLSFIIVDNMHPHALDEQIEARRDGIVSIAGIKKMDVWARCRLKLLSNPQQPFDELVYKCVALKIFDSKLIARFTFAIYTYGIPTEERYNDVLYSIDENENEILEAAKTILRYNLSEEAIYTVPRELWSKIMDLSKELEEKFGVEDIPLMLRNIPYKLAVLAYSFALLEGRDPPSERHYDLAYQWLDFAGRDIELDKYAEIQKALRNLSEEEFDTINKAIMTDIKKDVEIKGGEVSDSYLYRIIDFLVKHGNSRRDELAAYLEVEEKTVTRKVNTLKGLGLLRSGKDGYFFTPKGVRFVKKWISHVPDVPDVPTLEGDTRIEKIGVEKNKPRLTPESGDMRDMILELFKTRSMLFERFWKIWSMTRE